MNQNNNINNMQLSGNKSAYNIIKNTNLVRKLVILCNRDNL